MSRRSASSFSNGTITSPTRIQTSTNNGRLSSTTSNGRSVLTPTSPSRSPTRVSTTTASPRGSSASRTRTPSASRMSAQRTSASPYNEEQQMYARRQESEARGRSTTRSPVRNGSVRSPSRSPVRNGSSILNTNVRQVTSRSPSPVRERTSVTAPRTSSPQRTSTLASRRENSLRQPSTSGVMTLADLRSCSSAARSPSRSPSRSPVRNGSMRSPVRNGVRSPSRSPVRNGSMRSPTRSPTRSTSSGGSADTNAMLVCLLNGFDMNSKLQCVMVDLKAGYKAAEGVSRTVQEIISGLEDRKIFHKLLEMNGLSGMLNQLNGKVYTLFAPRDEALYGIAGGSTPEEAARNITSFLKSRGADPKAWLQNYISPFNFRQSHLRSLIGQPAVLQTQNGRMFSVDKDSASDSILVGESRVEGSGKAENGTVYLLDNVFVE